VSLFISELVYSLLESMMKQLPGQPHQEDCPPVLLMFHGYGLGVLLSKLVTKVNSTAGIKVKSTAGTKVKSTAGTKGKSTAGTKVKSTAGTKVKSTAGSKVKSTAGTKVKSIQYQLCVVYTNILY